MQKVIDEKRGRPRTRLGSNELKPLNFRVTSEFHREFKVYASQAGISMVELLEKSFRAYLTNPR
jgi:predicted HicB family RNase H-like nuclease